MIKSFLIEAALKKGPWGPLWAFCLGLFVSYIGGICFFVRLKKCNGTNAEICLCTSFI